MFPVSRNRHFCDEAETQQNQPVGRVASVCCKLVATLRSQYTVASFPGPFAGNAKIAARIENLCCEMEGRE